MSGTDQQVADLTNRNKMGVEDIEQIPPPAGTEQDMQEGYLSDDEDTVQLYDIVKMLNKFKKDNAVDQNTVLSFITHAAGVYALYSPDVQRRYKDLKPKAVNDPIVFDLSKVPENEFVVEFLSYLRLFNRSEKKHLDSGITARRDIFWNIFQERKLIKTSTKNDGPQRQEYVNFGSKSSKYVDILNDLAENEQKRQILLSSRINIKKGVDEQLSDNDNIICVWYLLFGTEVIRNPSALIHINMAFDLIEKEKIAWGNEMIENVPMCQVGIVKQAVWLNDHYSDYMPYKYRYSDPYWNPNKKKPDFFNLASELVQREARITLMWLELQLGKDESSSVLKRCGTDDEAVRRIFKLVMGSFTGWGLSGLEAPEAAPEVESQEVLPSN